MNHSMSTLDKMAQAYHKRVDKYTIRYETGSAFQKIDPKNLQPKERVIMGTYSRTWTKAMVREMLFSKTVDLGYGRCTLTDVARDYLVAKYPKRRILREQGKLLKQYPPPFYTKPGYFPAMAHIDIRAAYWTIMRIVGWDVDYWPTRWLAVGETMEDFPLPDNKTARNALHGVSLPNQIQIMTSHGLSHFWAYNKFLNLQVHTVISNVLHELARFAVAECECVYVNTDGYIVPQNKASDLMNEINRWGLSWKYEHAGNAVVLSSGIYRIADHRSKRPQSRPNALDNLVYFPESTWLWARLSKFARARVRIDNQSLVQVPLAKEKVNHEQWIKARRANARGQRVSIAI